MNDNRKFTSKSIQYLDGSFKSLMERWKNFHDENMEENSEIASLKDVLNNRGKLYDEVLEYNNETSLFDIYFDTSKEDIDDLLRDIK